MKQKPLIKVRVLSGTKSKRKAWARVIAKHLELRLVREYGVNGK